MTDFKHAFILFLYFPTFTDQFHFRINSKHIMYGWIKSCTYRCCFSYINFDRFPDAKYHLITLYVSAHSQCKDMQNLYVVDVRHVNWISIQKYNTLLTSKADFKRNCKRIMEIWRFICFMLCVCVCVCCLARACLSELAMYIRLSLVMGCSDMGVVQKHEIFHFICQTSSN